MNWTIFSTHSSTSDWRVDSHSNAASYGTTSCFLADSGRCQRRMLDIFSYCRSNNWFLLIPIQFIVHFHQAVLENNLAEITVAYESGWNKYTEKFYAKTEWPEAELIAPLVNDSSYSRACLFFFGVLLICMYVLFLIRRSYFPHPISGTLLPSCVLSPSAQHRRSLPFIRK